MSTRSFTVEHNGARYDAEQMVIRSTVLGPESHGIFSAYLVCEGNGSGISVGGYALDAYSETDNRRVGTVFGMEHILAILHAVGVEAWERLTGKQVLVLYADGRGGIGGTAVGIAHPIEDRVLIFKEQADEWRARGESA